MTTKTQRDLNLEYWGRIHDMCDAYNKEHGTNIKPRQCVKVDDLLWQSDEHPIFDIARTGYSLAVAIIEDMPVFAGDKIYHKAIEGSFYDCRYWTLTPPKKNRTFELNGQQLPCPSNDCDSCRIDLLGEYYCFESIEDRNKVAKALMNLLDDARDKE